MSDWGWVSLAYGVTYTAMIVYALSVVRRSSRLRRRLEELQ